MGGISESPDNSTILFVAETNPKFQDFYYQSNMYVVPADGGTPKALIPNFKYEVYDSEWSSDGKSIYFTANMGVHCEIFALNLNNKKIKQITDGKHSIYSFDYNPKIDIMVYSVNSPQSPATYWKMNMKSGSPPLSFLWRYLFINSVCQFFLVNILFYLFRQIFYY